MMKGAPGVSHVTHATTYLYGMLKQPVSKRGSILLGELVAIKLALQHIFQYKTVVKAAIKNVHILPDSQSAVGQLILGWENKSHQNTLQEVKTIKALSNS